MILNMISNSLIWGPFNIAVALKNIYAIQDYSVSP